MNINPKIAMFAALETVKYMSEKTGKIYSPEDIIKEIVENPESNTAKFFEKHLIEAYKVIEDVVNM